jgi:hypothetical protein
MTFGKRCPDCGSIERVRINRTQEMRLIPGSRHYMCIVCCCRYLFVGRLLCFPTTRVSNRRSTDFYQKDGPSILL